MNCIKVLSMHLISFFTFASSSNLSGDVEVGGALLLRTRELHLKDQVGTEEFLIEPSIPLKQYPKCQFAS